MLVQIQILLSDYRDGKPGLTLLHESLMECTQNGSYVMVHKIFHLNTGTMAHMNHLIGDTATDNTV